MAEIGELLALWQNGRRTSSSVKRIASENVAALDAKMAERAAVRKALQHFHRTGIPQACGPASGTA